MKELEELMDLCHARDLNYSITYQKMNDYSVEIYRGYVKLNFNLIFYTDGHQTMVDAVKKAVNFMKDLS